MQSAKASRLHEFVEWCQDHITGDEKGQAQVFLDRLFQAFGHKGVMEAGATLEMRVKREDRIGTAFADLVWKPHVLIEMKKRGEDLAKHYRQAFDYWVRLVPDRPRYVVLCNFDEFWVYDFETQMDVPVDQLPLTKMPERWGPLAFLFKVSEPPVFGNDQEVVTREAADLLARCFNHLIARKVDRDTAQRFTLQTLLALFAEDIGLLEPYTVARLLEACKTPKDAYDLIGGLFVEMNSPGKTPGGRFKGVDYFNGGLFTDPVRLELEPDEVHLLTKAAEFNWSQVRPEIFGTLFEHSLHKKERHAFGAHFTSPVDIMKIVGPTLVEPWRDAIENATTQRRLGELRQRMQTLRVLDPACGSGNFLYIAYRELKRLEARLLERLSEMAKRGKGQRLFSFVTARQFYGIDINPFAIEIAKVTMLVARKFAIDELHFDEQALPLDNLDDNFEARDALIDPAGSPAAWPDADVIIGNPPFLGAKRFKPEHGADYVNMVRAAYPDVPGMADYCVYWIPKAHDHVAKCTSSDPFTGRIGLVGTQNIRNNQSRVGGLDYVVDTGTIIEAVDNQPWSGEANVHVSIVNWVKAHDNTLLPPPRRLWFEVKPTTKRKRRPGQGPATKQYELNHRECTHINSALSDETDVSKAQTLACNTSPQRVFQGQTPGHDSFVLEPSEAAMLIAADGRNSEVIYPFLGGQDLVTGFGRPKRFVIDFQNIDVNEAATYEAPFRRIRGNVLPDRKRKAEEGKTKSGKPRSHHQLFLRYWWRQSYDRPEMIEAITALSRHVVCSRVTKRPIFCFVSPTVRPSEALMAFAFEDDYSFGVLQSYAHWKWFITKCSKLTARFRYTPPSVFDMFPWPQAPSNAVVDKIAVAARDVRGIRNDARSKKTEGGLRAVYRTLELPGANPLKDAHAALDTAVLGAYGFSARKDLLAQLLELNFAVADAIERGETVQAPGPPSAYPDTSSLVTDDCIMP